MPEPTLLAKTAAQVGGQAATAGMGMILGRWNDKRQLKQQGKLLSQQQGFDIGAMNYQHMLQMKMWEETGYKAQMEQMKKAGINPALMYGMGGGGGQSIGQQSASTHSAGAPAGGGEIMGMMGMRAQQAQIELTQAQKRNVDADTAEKLGWKKDNVEAGTKGINAETANKVLQGVILDVTGKDMESKWLQVTQPNRNIEGKTMQDELEARQGVAGTIYELWEEGKLKEKGLAEIEALALQNAKTGIEKRRIEREIDMLDVNIKGKKLENILTDLETKLQTQTGIDRASPWFVKTLGRLLLILTGKN